MRSSWFYRQIRTRQLSTMMWALFLGGKTDPYAITLAKWEEFIDARLSGRIDARGEPTDDPKPVRIRTVESNLRWLQWVFNWAEARQTPRKAFSASSVFIRYQG